MDCQAISLAPKMNCAFFCCSSLMQRMRRYCRLASRRFGARPARDGAHTPRRAFSPSLLSCSKRSSNTSFGVVLQPRREQRIEVRLLSKQDAATRDILTDTGVVPARVRHDELRPVRRIRDHLDLAPRRRRHSPRTARCDRSRHCCCSSRYVPAAPRTHGPPRSWSSAASRAVFRRVRCPGSRFRRLPACRPRSTR